VTATMQRTIIDGPINPPSRNNGYPAHNFRKIASRSGRDPNAKRRINKAIWPVADTNLGMIKQPSRTFRTPSRQPAREFRAFQHDWPR
jgi:hypothetical protein